MAAPINATVIFVIANAFFSECDFLAFQISKLPVLIEIGVKRGLVECGLVGDDDRQMRGY